MNLKNTYVAVASLLAAASYAQTKQPVAKVLPVTDTYFNTPVTENYRWMEDLKSDEMQQWMKAQATYTDAYLQKLPSRETFLKRLQGFNVVGSRVMSVSRIGNKYF